MLRLILVVLLAFGTGFAVAAKVIDNGPPYTDAQFFRAIERAHANGNACHASGVVEAGAGLSAPARFKFAERNVVANHQVQLSGLSSGRQRADEFGEVRERVL